MAIPDEHSTIAGRELLGIIQELEAEETAIRDHNKVKSDIIKEAGGKGWDKKTIRKVMAARRLDPLERDEQDNLFDMYMQAVETAEKASVHARVENAGKFGAAKPVEPTQEQPVEPASQSSGKASVSVDPSIDRVSPPASQASHGGDDANAGGKDEIADGGFNTTQTTPDEGATSLAAREGEQAAAPIPHSPASQASQDLQADKTSEAVTPPAASLASPKGTKLTNADCGSDSLHALHPTAPGQAGAVTSLDAPATLPDDDVPAFLRKQLKTMRPLCQHPDNCAGYGSHTCHGCKSAARESEAA